MKRHLANLKRSAARSSASVTNLVGSAALVVSLFGLAGCPGTLSFDPGTAGGTGGSGGNPDGGVETSCANATTVLQACTAVCHNAAGKVSFANLDLMSDGVAARLVGVAAATANNGLCGGKGNLLNRGTPPATGIFIDKITGQQTCGGSMPSGAPLLNATDQACLKAWANGLVASVGP